MRRFCSPGDTLFAGGIGRTDFPGGSLKQILHSIRDTLFCAARRNRGRSRPRPRDHQLVKNARETRTSGVVLMPDETEHDLEND